MPNVKNRQTPHPVSNNLLAPTHWQQRQTGAADTASSKLLRTGHTLATSLLAATLAANHGS